MKNGFLLLTILILFNFNTQAQYSCDFEDCGVNGDISECFDSTWGCGGGAGCNIVCSDNQAHSGIYSGIIPGDETTNAILDFGNQIFGEWAVEFWMYVPSNKEVYWNLQGVIPAGSGEWIVGNVFFNQDLANPGIGLIDDTALGEINFNFPHDQWFRIVMNFDISNGISVATWQFNVDGVDVVPFGTFFTNFNGDTPTSLGGVSFFSISSNNEFYLDDINFVSGFINPEPTPEPLIDDMESYTEGEAIYEGWWTTWGCGEGLGCALESSSAEAHGGVLSGLVPNDGTTDVVLDLGNKISDSWGLEFWAYIPEGKEAYFTIQESVPIGTSEPLALTFFNQGLSNPGQGIIEDTALGTVAFNFPHNQWFKITMNWDISNGISQATWQYIIDDEELIPAGTPYIHENGIIPAALGGIEFFSISTNNELYIDDFNYQFGILNINSFTKLNFVLYPNPSNDKIYIQSNNEIKSIVIYNLYGIIVKSSTSQTVDISALSTGIYFVKVETDSGLGIQKLIKK